MVGSRGVPATYGGIERHIEEIGARLSAAGHEVIVYGRRANDGGLTSYRGMRLEYVPTFQRKHFDTILHTGIATAHAIARLDPDVIHFHALGPGLVSPLAWLCRVPVVQTIHGLDGQRAKWGRSARTMLSAAEFLSARVPDATIVVAEHLARHYLSVHNRHSHVIVNGVDVPASPGYSLLGELGLEADGYVLGVGRLVPEKAPDLLIESYRSVPTDMPLIIAGGSSFSPEFERRLSDLAATDPRVRLVGPIQGLALHQLYCGAAAFVIPSLLEGLPLTLLEAVAHRVPIVASDIAPHVEILGDDGLGTMLVPVADAAALAAAIAATLGSAADAQARVTERAPAILDRYSWDRAASELDEVYHAVLRRRRRAAHR